MPPSRPRLPCGCSAISPTWWRPSPLFLLGNVFARFLARGVLISAVNHNLQYARLLSLGVKWLVLVLAAAMALEHLGIGGRIVELAFGILFGGIVLALALAVGLGSKDLVSRSLERQAERWRPRRKRPSRSATSRPSFGLAHSTPAATATAYLYRRPLA